LTVLVKRGTYLRVNCADPEANDVNRSLSVFSEYLPCQLVKHWTTAMSRNILGMNIGEIYFIRERDRRDGGSSGYVKIGMVSDISRGSRQRLGEH